MAHYHPVLEYAAKTVVLVNRLCRAARPALHAFFVRNYRRWCDARALTAEDARTYKRAALSFLEPRAVLNWAFQGFNPGVPAEEILQTLST